MTTVLLVVIYIAFISLGLPDSILGAAWPSMFEYLDVPVGYAGIITMIIAGGTIVSSLASNFVNKKLGTGKVMVISVAITAIALFGFSVSSKFYQLCLLGIPYGLGAGSVDSALNNYVALHYKARHMSWLHCFWGIGTMIGPVVMGRFISSGGVWTQGYRAISIFQVVLVCILALSLPLWKMMARKEEEYEGLGGQTPNSVGTDPDVQEIADIKEKERMGTDPEVTLKSAIRIKGVVPAILSFMCYCSVEATTGLWAATYMVFARGIEIELATNWAMLFFVGITVGRFINGFISEKFSDTTLIRFGCGIIFSGYIVLLLPFYSKWIVFGALILIGFGCAPIYPCLIHSTPIKFGKKYSQVLIGFQMAGAYTGSTFIPPLFGLIVHKFSVQLLPFYGMFFVLVLIILDTIGKTKCAKR